MTDTYRPGELFVYVNGDRWELGQVKRPNNDGTGYFCWYSMGDTCANTPLCNMHKLANAGWSHIERDGRETTRIIVKDNMNETEGMGDVWLECEKCLCKFDYESDEWIARMPYAPCCGRRIAG